MDKNWNLVWDGCLSLPMLWICDQIDHQTERTEWDVCSCLLLHLQIYETLPPMTASGNICGFCTQSYMQCYLRTEAEGMILSNNHTQMHTHRHSQTQAHTHLFWLLIKADNLSYRIHWPKCFGTLQQLSDHDLVQYLWSPSQILNLINFAASLKSLFLFLIKCMNPLTKEGTQRS